VNRVINSEIQRSTKVIQSQTNSENVHQFQSIIPLPGSNADDEPTTT
jgi:hypothetical protein